MQASSPALPAGALAGLRIAQYRGLLRHIGVSTHRLDVARAILERLDNLSKPFGTKITREGDTGVIRL